MPQVRVPLSKSGAVQTFRASNDRTVLSQHAASTLLTYLPMSAGWPPVSCRQGSVALVWVSYSSLYGHFTSASEDVRLDSKERAQFNGLANKLSSVCPFFAQLCNDA